jgi:hypothetical protein
MLRSFFAITLLATAAQAQTQTRAPIRQLGAIIAKAPVTFDTLINVRGLSDGRIIVNDAVGFKLITLDPTFTRITVWSDTSGTTKNSYGTQPAVMMPVGGDSSVIIELRSRSLIMIDPQGNYGRVFALPKTGDATAVMLSTMYGGGGIDPTGRLVHFGNPGPVAISNQVLGCGPTKPTFTSDSVPLVRANFESRTVDTIAKLRFSLMTADIIENPNQKGCWQWRQKVDVFPYYGDSWMLLPDGTVAIVRQADYHIDWVALDGSKTSSPKMPFDWRPIPAEEKQRMIDSVAKIQDSIAAARPVPPNAPPGFKPPPPPPVVSATEIPDYYPPTRLGTMKLDFDGNLWIPPTTSRDARDGLLYDVVNRKGEVIERVQLPSGRSIASFVPGGRVVLRTRVGNTVTLELAKVR